jgi:hypothetical protein
VISDKVAVRCLLAASLCGGLKHNIIYLDANGEHQPGPEEHRMGSAKWKEGYRNEAGEVQN